MNRYLARDTVWAAGYPGVVQDTIRRSGLIVYRVSLFGYDYKNDPFPEYNFDQMAAFHYNDKFKGNQNSKQARGAQSARQRVKKQGRLWGSEAGRDVGNQYFEDINVVRRGTDDDEQARADIERRLRGQYARAVPMTPSQNTPGGIRQTANSRRASEFLVVSTTTTPQMSSKRTHPIQRSLEVADDDEDDDEEKEDEEDEVVVKKRTHPIQRSLEVADDDEDDDEEKEDEEEKVVVKGSDFGRVALPEESRKRSNDSVRGAPEAKRQNNGDNNEQSMMGRVLGYIWPPFKSAIGASTSSSSE